MQVEVHIRNGRTAFRFAKRAHFRRALQNKPDHDGGRITCEVKYHPDDPQWRPVSIRAINPNSVSFVLEVPKEEPVEGGEES